MHVCTSHEKFSSSLQARDVYPLVGKHRGLSPSDYDTSNEQNIGPTSIINSGGHVMTRYGVIPLDEREVCCKA